MGIREKKDREQRGKREIKESRGGKKGVHQGKRILHNSQNRKNKRERGGRREKR